MNTGLCAEPLGELVDRVHASAATRAIDRYVPERAVSSDGRGSGGDHRGDERSNRPADTKQLHFIH